MKLNGDEDISSRMEVIESFTALAEEYDTLDEFLKAIDKMIKDSKDNNSKSDKVQLMTVHKAKGLEFPIVFFVGVNTDIIPHKKSTNIEEERRIAYVAVSRAMKELFVSWTLSYNNKPSNASIFIDNMIGKQKRKKIESDMGKADS
jgi:DNA helicase-2/ATP-dependent DNA helicase PcrA